MVKSTKLKLPFILFILISLYSYNDFITSEQAGFAIGQNRIRVYLFLLLIIFVQFSYLFFRIKDRVVYDRDSVSPILVVLLLWIGFVNIFNGRPLWISSIHYFLIIWWIICFLFNRKYVNNNLLYFNQYLLCYLLLFGVYVIFNLWARRNIFAYTERNMAITGYSYYMVVFLPFFFLIEKKWMRVLLFSVALVIIATSLKRGPILVTPCMLLVYYVVKARIGKTNVTAPLKVLALSFVLFALFLWANSFTNGALFDRFSADELESGSGRTEMWQTALSDIDQRDYLTFLIGRGSGSTIDLLQTGAHNEWIEFLYCFGAVGVVLYALFCIKLILIMKRSIKRKDFYAPELSMMVFFCLLSGLFSGFIFQYTSFYFFSFIGICQGLNKEH